MTDDAELLRHYADQGSDNAFTELVGRHFNLVWGTARRITGDADLARDVAQTVFTDLARKAARLPRKTVLAGWLYRAACHAAANAVRGNARRAERERQAMELHPAQADESTNARAADTLQPVLDEALGQLGDTDRDAVVLRFFAGKSLAEVGAALGTSDDAAQKRLSRALEKLRAYFQRRGAVVTGGAVLTALSAAGAQAAPAGLAITIATTSLAAAGATGASLSVFQLMTLMKTKLALAVIALGVVTVPFALEQRTMNQLREENRVLRQPAAQIAALRAENARLAKSRVDAEELARLRGEHVELLRLRGEVGRLRKDLMTGNANLPREVNAARTVAEMAPAPAAQLTAEDQERLLSADTVNAMKQLGLAARIFATDHNDRLPMTFEEMKNELPEKLPGGLALDRFEFVQHARPVSEMEPDKLLFRELTVRIRPDGKWLRVYGLCDGSVIERVSEDGKFALWENEHIVKETAAK